MFISFELIKVVKGTDSFALWNRIGEVFYACTWVGHSDIVSRKCVLDRDSVICCEWSPQIKPPGVCNVRTMPLDAMIDTTSG